MAIYDAMQYVRPPVSTICVGMGMSAAAMILCGGAPGKRFALPNAKIMIHQGSAGLRGTPATSRSSSARSSITRRWPRSSPATGPVCRAGEPISTATASRMTPVEAVDYGLMDAMIERH